MPRNRSPPEHRDERFAKSRCSQQLLTRQQGPQARKPGRPADPTRRAPATALRALCRTTTPPATASSPRVRQPQSPRRPAERDVRTPHTRTSTGCQLRCPTDRPPETPPPRRSSSRRRRPILEPEASPSRRTTDFDRSHRRLARKVSGSAALSGRLPTGLAQPSGRDCSQPLPQSQGSRPTEKHCLGVLPTARPSGTQALPEWR
jgi:hypothetical protein